MSDVNNNDTTDNNDIVDTPKRGRKKTVTTVSEEQKIEQEIPETEIKTAKRPGRKKAESLPQADIVATDIELNPIKTPELNEETKETPENNNTSTKQSEENINNIRHKRNTETMNIQDLDTCSIETLRQMAEKNNIDHIGMERQEIKMAIILKQTKNGSILTDKGVLEIIKDQNGMNAWGFLRHGNFSNSPSDIYISLSQIKRFALKTGDIVTGIIRNPKDNEKFCSLLRVEDVNSRNPEVNKRRKPFEELTPLYPDNKYTLELLNADDSDIEESMSLRVIDIFAPIGRGQRGLIVAPPKAGKTTLLKDIANAFVKNYPETFMIILLVDERPEEVTDIKRSVRNDKYPDRVRVVASTFDEPPETHMHVSDIVLEMSKRLVESGHDVVVLLDSITRMARSSNLTVSPSGRTLSGGLDPAALYRPKRFIGAARNIEDGGSLTVIATALIDTGSKMDDSIFEEFKATGNMELVLDRNLAEKRIFPAIDIKKSGTRHDEKLFNADEFKSVLNLQRALSDAKFIDKTEIILKIMKSTKSNVDFMLSAPAAIPKIKEQMETKSNGKY